MLQFLPLQQQLQQTMAATHALIDKYAEIYDHANATQELLLDGSWELQKVRAFYSIRPVKC